MIIVDNILGSMLKLLKYLRVGEFPCNGCGASWGVVIIIFVIQPEIFCLLEESFLSASV